MNKDLVELLDEEQEIVDSDQDTSPSNRINASAIRSAASKLSRKPIIELTKDEREAVQDSLDDLGEVYLESEESRDLAFAKRVFKQAGRLGFNVSFAERI